MKTKEIRELSIEELRDKTADKAEELANLKFQLSLHQLDNTAKVRIERRELARLKTILKEQEEKMKAQETVDASNTQESK